VRARQHAHVRVCVCDTVRSMNTITPTVIRVQVKNV